MKKNTSRLFTIIAIGIYLIAIIFFTLNLTKEYITAPEHTRITFDTSISQIKKDLPGKQVSSTIFNEAITNCFPDLTAYSYIEVFLNGETVYKYQLNELESSNESRLIKPYFTSFKLQEDNYFISANLYKLKPVTIYYNARITFLVILIVTIIAIILIIITNNSIYQSNSEEILLDDELDSVSDENLEESDNENFNIEENNENSDIEIESANKIATDINDKIENSSDFTEADSQIMDNEILVEEPVLEENDGIELESTDVVEETPVLPSEEIKPAPLEDTVPEGLFSPVTGLGWEQYLLTRLDSEINRAISSEFDLSLFIIKITNISRGSDTVKKVCEHLTTIFQFKDLLFEYKEDCIVAIKISMNIDEAITLADTIYNEITEILKDSFAKCYIGISSKTIRMISGERLLKEADEALAHAEGTPDSPIMGFRADAEKFRKYFENQQ